jgi:hypothetical protein
MIYTKMCDRRNIDAESNAVEHSAAHEAAFIATAVFLERASEQEEPDSEKQRRSLPETSTAQEEGDRDKKTASFVKNAGTWRRAARVERAARAVCIEWMGGEKQDRGRGLRGVENKSIRDERSLKEGREHGGEKYKRKEWSRCEKVE